MSSLITRLNSINRIRDELEELIEEINSPKRPHKLGEMGFREWDLFHRNSALTISALFGKNSSYLLDWKKIEIPEEPDLEDDKGLFTYIHKQELAQDKMRNQLEIMSKEVRSTNKKEAKQIIIKPVTKSKIKNKVFIVHGTDHQPVNQLKVILKEVGIIPIVLNEQPSRGSMTIIEKLEEYGDVGFAFVILTPDDIGVKRQVISESYGAYNFGKDASNPEIIKWAKGLHKPIADFLLDKIQHSIQNRARQNVILEFGYFIGKLGRNKVCCLYNGDLELPSDMQGICYARFNDSINEVKDLIVDELRVANIIKP